jgi:hypothetical protein
VFLLAGDHGLFTHGDSLALQEDILESMPMVQLA